MSRTSRELTPDWPVSIREILDAEQLSRSATWSMVVPAASRRRRSSCPSWRRRNVGLPRRPATEHLRTIDQYPNPVQCAFPAVVPQPARNPDAAAANPNKKLPSGQEIASCNDHAGWCKLFVYLGSLTVQVCGSKRCQSLQIS